MPSLTLRRNSLDLAQAFQALPLECALAEVLDVAVESFQISESHRGSLNLKHEHAAEIQRDLVEKLLLHSDDTITINGCRLTALQCCLVALYQCAPIAQLLLEHRAREAEQQRRQDKRELLASKGFVYLREVDQTIVEELRYFSEENFVGARLTGYESPRAIVTLEAAHALSCVQADIAADGFTLVIYDAYRPQQAVDHVVAWTHDEEDQCAKHKYYPCVDKSEIVSHGYVAPCSGHTRGSTLDLTIMKKELVRPHATIKISERKLRNGDCIPYLDDGTVDMGTSFDFFGEASRHDSDLVDEEQVRMRHYLRDKMRLHGFRHLPEEWWHYTLDDEPFANTYFDFPVEH